MPFKDVSGLGCVTWRISRNKGHVSLLFLTPEIPNWFNFRIFQAFITSQC
jgi:hypothetical protein